MTPGEENRRAIIHIDPHTLRRLLNLPDGLYVSHIWAELDPPSIRVVVEGPGLEPAPIDCALPGLAGWWRTEECWENDRMFVRWGWTPERTPA